MLSVILIFALAVGGCACAYWGVRGNGKLISQNRKVNEFNKMKIEGAFDVKVKCGYKSSLKIIAEENLMPLIKTEVYNNTLFICSQKNILPKKKLEIEITVKDLNEISCSGANKVLVENIKTDNFIINLSGADYVKLKGEVDDFKAKISGAGSLDARELKAGNVYVSVSGTANANVYASNFLDASISGVGNISYYGNPEKIKSNISGIGSITRK